MSTGKAIQLGDEQRGGPLSQTDRNIHKDEHSDECVCVWAPSGAVRHDLDCTLHSFWGFFLCFFLEAVKSIQNPNRTTCPLQKQNLTFILGCGGTVV